MKSRLGKRPAIVLALLAVVIVVSASILFFRRHASVEFSGAGLRLVEDPEEATRWRLIETANGYRLRVVRGAYAGWYLGIGPIFEETQQGGAADGSTAFGGDFAVRNRPVLLSEATDNSVWLMTPNGGIMASYGSFWFLDTDVVGSSTGKGGLRRPVLRRITGGDPSWRTVEAEGSVLLEGPGGYLSTTESMSQSSPLRP